LTEEAQSKVKNALITYYFDGNAQGKEDDLRNHLILRLENNRKEIIPCIDAHHNLADADGFITPYKSRFK
jgi:hypothetical protein